MLLMYFHFKWKKFKTEKHVLGNNQCNQEHDTTQVMIKKGMADYKIPDLILTLELTSVWCSYIAVKEHEALSGIYC